MASSNTSLFCIVTFLCFVDLASSSSFLSGGIFESDGAPPGRTLLQVKKKCTVDFENQNYTILTSRCKGPGYNASICCRAMKEFACPFDLEFNDLESDCATTMFSYLHIYGKYPPGLFSNLCIGTASDGIECADVLPPSSSSYSSPTFFIVIVIAAASLLLLFLT